MKINSKILKILREHNIGEKPGIIYLLKIYHNLFTDKNPVLTSLQRTGIYQVNAKGEIKWLVSLYEPIKKKSTPDLSAFAWVKPEYVALFKEVNPAKAGNGMDATRRMKKLFAENPDVRKHEIIGATKLYLAETDPNYIRYSHFFIYKGQGADKITDILSWVEKFRYKEEKANSAGSSISNTLQ